MGMTPFPQDGGSAFPGSYPGQHGQPVWSNGMSLRDWFAGMALQGLVSESNLHNDEAYTDVALDAYKLADAMLRQREQP